MRRRAWDPESVEFLRRFKWRTATRTERLVVAAAIAGVLAIQLAGLAAFAADGHSIVPGAVGALIFWAIVGAVILVAKRS